MHHPIKTYLVKELAHYLRVHPHTIRRLARERKLPSFKTGGQWRFDSQAIEEWKQSYLWSKGEKNV